MVISKTDFNSWKSLIGFDKNVEDAKHALHKNDAVFINVSLILTGPERNRNR